MIFARLHYENGIDNY